MEAEVLLKHPTKQLACPSAELESFLHQTLQVQFLWAAMIQLSSMQNHKTKL